MRMTPFELSGTTYHLLLNGSAMFDIYDKYGSDISIVDPIKGNSKKAFEAVCWYLEVLATQGEMFRRKQGFDRGPIPSADALRLELSPLDVTAAKVAIKAAVYAGFAREEGEPKEIDKGLLELEKKTGGN